MPKYLFTASYTAEGIKGLLKDGGSKRREVAGKLIESLGGTIEAMYFYASGDADIVLIADLPDIETFAATGLATRAAGALETGLTIELLTPEQMDEATKKNVSYRPPGQ